MRLYFALIGLALLVAAIVGAPLAWDGSYVEFTTLDRQALYSSHGRYYHTVLTVPLLALSWITSDMRILTAAYVAMEVAVPLVALGLSWLVVRKNVPALFLWPALGIVATLPGQFAFDSEGLAAVQLFWPLLLLLLVRNGRVGYLAIGVLAVTQILIYPIAIVLFAIAASTCLVVTLRGIHSRRAGLVLVLSFGVLGLITSLAARSAYDAEILAADHLLSNLRAAFYYSVLGRSLLAILATWTTGTLILLAQREERSGRISIGYVANALALFSIGGVVVILLPWAADPTRWAAAESFRFWALAASLPLMAMSVWERVRIPRDDTRNWELTDHRTRILHVTGAVFLLILSVQGLGWMRLRDRLAQTLVENPGTCIPSGSLAWLAKTPLSHWSISYHSIILQGRAPAALVLNGDGCTSQDLASRIRLAPWDTRERDHGWFDLRTTGRTPGQ